jgi:hypothetical protein
LCGVTGGDRKSRGAALERGDALLEHGVGRIADAGVDVAEGLKADQRGGVIDVVEHERRGLVDRGRARAGGRVRLRAGMDRERGKAGGAFGHGARPGAVARSHARTPLVYRTSGRRQGENRRGR